MQNTQTGKRGVLSLMVFFSVLFTTQLVTAEFGGSDAHADYMQQPVQELVDDGDYVYDLPRETDYSIDETPQYPPPDTEDLMDANDAEVTTPIASFLFWGMMAVFAVGISLYLLARYGGISKQQA